MKSTGADEEVGGPGLSRVGLPEGWAEATLDQVLEALESGSRPKGGVRGISEGVPSIGGEHLDDRGRFRFQKIKYVPHSFYSHMARGRIHQGDILVVKDGATTGKVALVRHDFPYDPAVVNEHVFICRLLNDVHPPFLFYFLWSEEGQRRILDNFRGSAQGGINQGFASGTSVPLAPAREQQRIATKAEELLARVNASRERLRRVPAILRRFRQAVLAAACSGRLTADWREEHADVEPASLMLERVSGRGQFASVPDEADPIQPPEIPEVWAWSRCEHLCDARRAITYGVIKLGPAVDGGVSTLRSSDVRWLRIDEQDVKTISPEIAARYSRTFLKGGEVVVTVRGTLGGVAVVPSHLAGWNVSREVAVLPVIGDLDAMFFSCAIASTWSQNWLMEMAKGVAYTGVNIRDLKRLPLLIPPLEEQHEIVRRVEALFKLADAIEQRVAAATARADKIVEAILARAFRGELVPTEAELARREGRDYEPASVLLERIQREREATVDGRKRKR